MKVGQTVTLPLVWKVVLVSRLDIDGKPGPITSITLSYQDVLFVVANTPHKVELLRRLVKIKE